MDAINIIQELIEQAGGCRLLDPVNTGMWYNYAHANEPYKYAITLNDSAAIVIIAKVKKNGQPFSRHDIPNMFSLYLFGRNSNILYINENLDEITWDNVKNRILEAYEKYVALRDSPVDSIIVNRIRNMKVNNYD